MVADVHWKKGRVLSASGEEGGGVRERGGHEREKERQ